MKTRMIVTILILDLTVLVVLGSCATDPMKYISKDYEIYGTWINPEYDLSHSNAKFIISPNGKIDLFPTAKSSVSNAFREFYITNKWIDSEGNVWYTYKWKNSYYAYYSYALAKISNSGMTMETALYSEDYPKEIDPDGMYLYEIHYRQE
jgi:hypothetical protein